MSECTPEEKAVLDALKNVVGWRFQFPDAKHIVKFDRAWKAWRASLSRKAPDDANSDG